MKKISTMFLFLLVVIVLTGCSLDGLTYDKEPLNEGLTLVTIDINPSFALIIDQLGQVKSLLDLNEDGKEIISRLTRSEGSLETILDELFALIETDDESEIEVDDDGEDDGVSEAIRARIENHLNVIFAKRQQRFEMIQAKHEERILGLSEKLKSTPAYARLMERLHPALKDDPEAEVPEDEDVFASAIATSMTRRVPEDIINQDRLRVILQFKREISEDLITRTQGNVLNRMTNVPIVSMEIPRQALAGLVRHPLIDFVEIDDEVTISTENEWGIQKTQAPTIWQSGFTGKGIKVGIIDTGIALHPDLNIAGGRSFVDYTSSFYDDNGHGTHVAGIVGALRNQIGMVGVAYDSELYALKVLNQNGAGYLSSVVSAIDYAITLKLDVINLSLGTASDSLSLKSIVDKAVSQNVMVIAAAGNSGTSDSSLDNIQFPAKYANVIAVGAIDSREFRPNFSSTGPQLELSAPGVSILSTTLNGQYQSLSGTSMAAPFVTGFYALLKEAYPNLTLNQYRELLQKSTKDLGILGRDNAFGFGLIKPFPLPIENPSEPVEEPVDPENPSETVENPSLTLITTDLNSYRFGDVIDLTVTVTDENALGLPNTSLLLVISPPRNGRFNTLRVQLTTNEEGVLVYKISIPRNAQIGTYTVFVNASPNGYLNSSHQITFQVSR